MVFDEFPYLILSNKALPSILQRFWDESLKNLNIFLILCGSYISVMEEEVLSHKSPLYGRRTSQILLEPLNFFQFSKFFPKLAIPKKIELYSIVGGIPGYILQFKGKNIFKEIEKIRKINKKKDIAMQLKNNIFSSLKI